MDNPEFRQEYAQADAEFVLLDAAVADIHAARPRPEGVAAGDIGETVAEVELDVGGKVHGSTGHQGIGEAQAIPPLEPRSGAARPAACGVAPVEIGRTQPHADIGREAGQRAEVDIAVGHNPGGGIIGLEGAWPAGAGRAAAEIIPGIIDRHIGARQVVELIAEAETIGERPGEAAFVEFLRHASFRDARPPALDPAGIAEIAANVPAAGSNAFRHVDFRRVDDLQIARHGARRDKRCDSGDAKRCDAADHCLTSLKTGRPVGCASASRHSAALHRWLTIFLKE